MCVIAVANEKRLSESMVADMWAKNRDGGGVAWRDRNVAGKSIVRWKKGLSEEQMQEVCASLPLPYIAHFRIQTVGGDKPELTHPFAIDEFAKSLDCEGETLGGVLFHNGHWTDWKKMVLQIAVGAGMKIPDGLWTDTRAMAFAASVLGTSVLDFLDERTAVMTPKTISFTGGWVRVNDIICSNDLFEKKVYHNHYSGHISHNRASVMCRHGRCTTAVNLNAEGFCLEHIPVPSQGQTVASGQVTTSTNGTSTALVLVASNPTAKEASAPLTPFALRNQLAQMEKEWAAYKAKQITRTDLSFSKKSLNRYRAAVAALTVPSVQTLPH